METNNFEIKKTMSLNPALNAPLSKGKVFETPLEKYFELTQSEKLKNLVDIIRQTEDEAKRRELKTNLPIRCPHYFRFRNNHRAQDDLLSDEFTFQTCVDIDIKEQVEPALERAYLINSNEGEWKGKLLHVEKSASGKAHLDIRIPVGMTIREAQVAYCQALGIDFDENCITPERMIYITDAASQLYTSDDWYAKLPEAELAMRRKAYTDRGLGIDGRELKSEPSSAKQETEPSKTEGNTSSSYPQEYQGIPYSYIVEELTDQMGGVPEHGNRNSFIYSMACHLRHVCNDDPNWIEQILPNFGESQARVHDSIASACKRAQTKTMPQKISTAIQLARVRSNIEKGLDPDSLMSQPKMPERLPAVVRLMLSKAPKGYHPAIATAIFPAFATYTGDVTAVCSDNTITKLTLLDGLVAPMSIGKSSIKEPINRILKPIKERDKMARAKERDWAEVTNSKGANAEKPERPKDICVQVVDSDMTNAAFCQRLEDAERAGNKALFTRMDEVEQLKKLAGGNMVEVTEILRRDFDGDEYGQERAGSQSIKVRSTLNWNLVFSTTPTTFKKMFGCNIDNGTFSRLNLCTIVEEDVERRPKFKIYDEAFDKKLAVYLARLESAKGQINCSQARDLTDNLLDRAEDRSLMMGNKAYEKLSYRSAMIAFRKSILLYIMNGMKWSKDIEEFITWSFDYDLWNKMCILGEEAQKKLEQDRRVMKPGVPCMLEQMGDSFTREEYNVMERANCPNTRQPGNLLSQWKKRQWIDYNEDLKIYSKTAKYYEIHAA